MANKKFEDYGFKPSAVIAGLNRWYEAKDERALIWFSDHDAWPNHYFYDHDKAIDDAIKYLRGMDIFYRPGLKWDDVKFKLNSKACRAEYGFCDVHDAWPKANPAIDQRKLRDVEIRDYILKCVYINGIKIPESFRDPDASVENLIAYLFTLLMQERKNKELAEEIRDRYCEKNAKLQKELDQWERWFEQQTKYMNDIANYNRCNDYLYRRELGLPDNATVADILERIRDIRKANENQAKYASKLVQSIADISKERDEADRLRRHWHSKYEKEHEESVRLSKLHAADKEKKDEQDVVIHNLRDNNTTLEYSVAALKNKIRNMEAEASEKETKTKVITDTLRDNLVDSIEECKRLNAKIKDLERTIRTLDDEEDE